MSNFDTSLDPQRQETLLTPQEQAVRDFFVNEYVKDFDAYKACIRMGFLSAFAIDQCKSFMADGYVLRKIDHLTRQVRPPSEEDKAAMLENLRWLAFNATASVRATATKNYMEAKGYVQSDTEQGDAKIAALTDAMIDFAKAAPA